MSQHESMNFKRNYMRIANADCVRRPVIKLERGRIGVIHVLH